MESRIEKAVSLFKQGYNCAQSVFAAYSDLYGMDEGTAIRLSSSFGGGMGRMREVCGAVSGMLMIAGLETGTVDGHDAEGRNYNYMVVQRLAQEFRDRNGSIICRELLGISQEQASLTDPVPEKRTDEYYKKRPCIRLIEDAADILENMLLDDMPEKEGNKNEIGI